MGIGIALLAGISGPIVRTRPNIIFISIWDSMGFYCLKLLRVDDLFLLLYYIHLIYMILLSASL